MLRNDDVSSFPSYVTETVSSPASGSAVVKASKVLDGKALDDGEFEFELHDGDGKVLSTARNDANGNIEFAPIEYTLEDVGTHGYTVREIPGNELGISYDEKVADVSVDVSGELPMAEALGLPVSRQ